MANSQSKSGGICMLSAFCIALALLSTAATRPARAAANADQSYRKEIKPLLTQYCYSCHDDAHHRSGLSLEKFTDLGGILTESDTWAEVMRKVRTGEMPPEGKPQPSDAERQRVADWIENQLFPVDCEHPDPGRVTIRRLNRAEYNNTIRDLVGLDLHPADDFPVDDSGYGFDNIGDVLTLSPLLLEKYLAAADKVLSKAFFIPEEQHSPKLVFGPKKFGFKGGGTLSDSSTFTLHSAGEAFVTATLTNPGEFTIRVLASAQQAGPEPAKLELRVDGRPRVIFEVKAVEGSARFYETNLTCEPGQHRVAAAFVNDYYDEKDPDPNNRDRNLLLHAFEIVGPLHSSVDIPESQRRILFVKPGPNTTNDCSRQIISGFASRAFRRPVSRDELDRLCTLAESARKDGASFELSIKVALEAVLVSPHFLFRGELGPGPDNPAGVKPLNDYALASRLSYFLWSSMPDDELFSLAAKGQLRKNVEKQALRMLRDPKAHALVSNFGGQWLQTRMLNQASPDPSMYPDFDEELRSAMATETEMLLQDIVENDRSILDLLTADYSFLNERLARNYGIEGVTGPEFRRVSLKGTGRAGVITHGSVLTLTSNPTRTSPVKRGKWVLENLLAQAPPPPPPGVPPLKDAREDAASSSLRTRMEQHRSDPLCASCHSVMDPIGFSLDNFDAIGVWREKDGSFEVDASGKLPTGENFSGATGLRDLLVRRKDQFARCVTEKMLTYALGRGLERYDRCAVDRIAQQAAARNYRFSSFVTAIIKSVPFQMQRAEPR